MRFLILSDLHANLEALQAVLADAGRRGFDSALCLGDVVGYGPDPNACVEWAASQTDMVVRGNHDRTCCGLTDAENFRDVARTSAKWTRAELTDAHSAWLASLGKFVNMIDAVIVSGASAAAASSSSDSFSSGIALELGFEISLDIGMCF